MTARKNGNAPWGAREYIEAACLNFGNAWEQAQRATMDTHPWQAQVRASTIKRMNDWARQFAKLTNDALRA